MKGNISAANELWYFYRMTPQIRDFVLSKDMTFEELVGSVPASSFKLPINDLERDVNAAFNLLGVIDNFDIDEGPEINENLLDLNFTLLESEYPEHQQLLVELYLTFRFLGICNLYEVSDIIESVQAYIRGVA